MMRRRTPRSVRSEKQRPSCTRNISSAARSISSRIPARCVWLRCTTAVQIVSSFLSPGTTTRPFIRMIGSTSPFPPSTMSSQNRGVSDGCRWSISPIRMASRRIGAGRNSTLKQDCRVRVHARDVIISSSGGRTLCGRELLACCTISCKNDTEMGSGIFVSLGVMTCCLGL
jgi:hypothetical protein